MRPMVKNILWGVAEELGLPTVPSVSHEAARALLHYEGSPTILRNLLEKATLTCFNGRIEYRDLGLPVDPLLVGSNPNPIETPELPTLNLDQLEREAVSIALRLTEGNRTKAATMLGIGLRTLRAKLTTYRMNGIEGEHFASRSPHHNV